MFDSLRDAFREAVSNFKEEIGRDDVPETVDRLLVGMRNEVTDTKAYVRRLEGEIEQAEAKAVRARKESETARRREGMAQQIGDQETARVAAEYAAKAERVREVLEQKALALRKELQLKEAEVAEMMTALKAAMADRDRLTATAGRAQSRNSLSEADDLFAQLDRMAEKIDGTDAQAQAAREIDETFESTATDPDLEQQFDALEDEPDLMSVEDRLEELKRRMGQSD